MAKRKSPSRKRKSPRPCKPTQERNPNTNRCILKCNNEYERNPDNFSKCRKTCVPPQVRNPPTKRCKKPPSPRKRKVKTATRKNPVRLVRKVRTPLRLRDCSVCLEPTYMKTFCTSGRRHPLCLDDYYRLLGTGIHYCPICREHMDRPPAR